MNKRQDFPIFSSGKYKKTYLDSAATTHKPKRVIDKVSDFYSHHNANVHRGIYDPAEQASAMYEEARDKIAKFINADPSEIVFTSGATEGVNFVADSWGRKNLSKGDEIIVSEAEHHANLLPWQRLASETGAVLKHIPLDSTFTLDWSGLISQKTKMVAVTTSSNVLGPVWSSESDIARFIAKAHEVGAAVLLDAAQTVPHTRVDVKKLNPDFMVFSGHKMLAPTGVGVLYINKHLEVEPYQVGGSMVHSAGRINSTWKNPPHKFEAGTPPIAQAIALGEAVDYLEQVDFDALKKHESGLCELLIKGLEKYNNVKLLGNIERIKSEGHLVSFSIDNVHAHDLTAYLNSCGILVRAGHHCTQPLHDLLNIESSVRVSFYLYNTQDDVQEFLTAFEKALRYFGGVL